MLMFVYVNKINCGQRWRWFGDRVERKGERGAKRERGGERERERERERMRERERERESERERVGKKGKKKK